MVYDNNAANTSSTSLKPVLLVVSLVTATIFGGMYAFYSNSQQSAPNPQAPAAAAQEQVGVQSQSQAAVGTASKAKSHSHV